MVYYKYLQPTGPGTTRMTGSRSSISPFVRLQSARLRPVMKRQSKRKLRPPAYWGSFPPSVGVSALVGLAGSGGCIFQPIWLGRRQVQGPGWNSEAGPVWGQPPIGRPPCWSVHAGLVLKKVVALKGLYCVTRFSTWTCIKKKSYYRSDPKFWGVTNSISSEQLWCILARFAMTWNDSLIAWCLSPENCASWFPSCSRATLVTLQPNSDLVGGIKSWILYIIQSHFVWPEIICNHLPHHPVLPRCIPSLETAIKEVDGAFDSCNEAWARGEADKFRSKEFLIFQLTLTILKHFMHGVSSRVSPISLKNTCNINPFFHPT